MSKALLLFVIIYTVGVMVSQSLMSVAATALLLLAVRSMVLASSDGWVHQRRFGVVVLTGLTYVVFESVYVAVLMPYDRGWDVLRAVPLLLLPSAGIIFSYSKFSFDWFYKEVLAKIVLLGGVVLLGLSLYQVFSLKIFACGFFGNPIYFAYAIFPLTVFCLEEFFTDAKRNTVFGLAGTFLLLSLVLSQSRMVLLVMFVYLLFRGMRLVSGFAKHRALFLCGALVFLAGCFLLWWNMPQFQEKLHRTLSGKDPSLKWRWVAWEYNWKLFLTNPWLGVGPENNGIDVAQRPELAGGWAPGRLIFAHSIFLQKLAESGLVGFVLFFTNWVCLFYFYAPVRLFVTMLLVSGLTENIFNNSKAAHGLYLVLFLVLMRGAREDNRYGTP